MTFPSTPQSHLLFPEIYFIKPFLSLCTVRFYLRCSYVLGYILQVIATGKFQAKTLNWSNLPHNLWVKCICAICTDKCGCHFQTFQKNFLSVISVRTYANLFSVSPLDNLSVLGWYSLTFLFLELSYSKNFS